MDLGAVDDIYVHGYPCLCVSLQIWGRVSNIWRDPIHTKPILLISSILIRKLNADHIVVDLVIN